MRIILKDSFDENLSVGIADPANSYGDVDCDRQVDQVTKYVVISLHFLKLSIIIE